MGDRKKIGSLFCFLTNRARNRMANRTRIRTRVDSPLSMNQKETKLRICHNRNETKLFWAIVMKSHFDKYTRDATGIKLDP
jgi:hypothetical protein